MFRDRGDAARELADALKWYEGISPLVLATPRGAVEMGAIVAEELGDERVVELLETTRNQTPPPHE